MAKSETTTKTKATKAKKATKEVETNVEAVEAEVKPVKAVAKKKVAKTDLTKVDAKGLQEMRQQYFQHRLDVMLGKDNDTAKLKNMRRDIARAMMYLNINTETK